MKRVFLVVAIALIMAVPALTSAEEQRQTADQKGVAQSAAPAAATGEQKPAEPPAASKPVKIGFADIIRVAAESKQGKEAQSRIKARSDKLQKQLEAKKKQLEKQKNAIEAKLASLTPQQRAAKAREFEKKVEEFQKAAEAADKELQTLQEDLTKGLYKIIEEAAMVYGADNGLSAIVVKKELLYLGSGVEPQDVTEELVKLVNAREAKP